MREIHKVKSWTHLYEAAVNGTKTHDVRYVNERDYKVGDLLLLQEFDHVTQKYTGRQCFVEITYITSDINPCALSRNALDRGYCILSIRKL
jgi:hypothetical protein